MRSREVQGARSTAAVCGAVVTTPTLDELTRAISPLHFVNGPDATVFGHRTVTGTWIAHGFDRAAGMRARGLLVVVPSHAAWLDGPRLAEAVRVLAEAGAAGLAVSGKSVARAVVEAARHRRLPVLHLDPGAAPEDVAASLAALGWREETARRIRLQHLHSCARELRGGDEACVLRWLRKHLGSGATVKLIGPYEIPALEGRLLEAFGALRGGRRASIVDVGGQVAVRMYALGERMPHTVLFIALPGRVFPQAAAQLVEEALPFLILAQGIRQAARDDRRRTAEQLFTFLLEGDVAGAVRAARPLRIAPGLLDRQDDATMARVYLFGCPRGRPTELAAACEHLVGVSGLVVAHPGGLVIVVRDDPHGGVGRALRALVVDRADHRLGVSLPVPLDQVTVAHGMATRALAVAGHCPVRAAQFEPEWNACALLPVERSRVWAQHLLYPLGAWAEGDRRTVLDTAQAWLRYGTGGAAAVMGVTPNGVRKRLARLSRALGLDLTVLGHRVALDAAVRIFRQSGGGGWPSAGASRETAEVVGNPAGVVAGLAGLLADETVRGWAADYLGRVPDDTEDDVRRTLIAWVASGAHTGGAAERLGLHYKVVRRQLGVAESVLRRRLLSHPRPGRHGVGGEGSFGVQDVVLAAVALGEVSWQDLLDVRRSDERWVGRSAGAQGRIVGARLDPPSQPAGDCGKSVAGGQILKAA